MSRRALLAWIPLGLSVGFLAGLVACGDPFSLTGGSDVDGGVDAGPDVDLSGIVLRDPTAEAGDDGALKDDAEADGAGDRTVQEAGPDSTLLDGGGADRVDAAGDALDATQDNEVPACVGGGACSSNECQNGTWACVDGGRVCQETSAVGDGTPCGSAAGDAGAHVCNGGQCAPCNAGGDCSTPSTPCVKRSYDCSSGSAQCVIAGNVADGVSCGTALYCNGGACSACQVGAACLPAGNPCHLGKVTACSAGGVATCTDQGTPASAGNSCTATGGAGGVCDGNGGCVACSTGSQCNPNGNPCQVGVQSCSAGPQCTNPSNVRESQTCASGKICHAGACLTCDGTSCAAGCCDGNGCVTTGQGTNECGNGTAGGACAVCPGPSAGTGNPTCTGNACAIACGGATTMLCGDACVDPQSDINNCGRCGITCSGGETCQGGRCACPPSAPNLCGGTCINVMGSDGNNCDACGHTCLGGTCSAGQCQPFAVLACASEHPTPISMVDSNAYYFLSGFTGSVSGLNKSTGTSLGIDIGPAVTGIFSFAQDSTNLYIGVEGVCVESKTMPSFPGCNATLYPTQGMMGPPPSLNAIAESGSQLWWILGPDLVTGNISGAPQTILDTGAGTQLAADANGVVWSESSGQLTAAPINPTTRVPLLMPAGASPAALAIDATNAYWFNRNDSNLYRAARDGSAMANLTPGAPLARAVNQLAVDSTYVYWTDFTAGTVSRVPIAGGGGVTVIANTPGADGIAVDTAATVAPGAQQAIYWMSFTNACPSGVQGDSQLTKLAK